MVGDLWGGVTPQMASSPRIQAGFTPDSVSKPMPTSRETSSNAVLSGGSNRTPLCL